MFILQSIDYCQQKTTNDTGIKIIITKYKKISENQCW